MKNVFKIILVVTFLTSTQNSLAWERGDRAYMCIKVPAVQCLFQWGFGCGYESCRVRILENGNSNIKIEFEQSCGMGWSSGETKWANNSELFSGNDCNSHIN